ncbi:hypothetical protein [uncultured Mucilaginibacter sp.]|uniref:hypothetical protein n=1 Tax=uncultured Mucilaginibacter sp. TaxID=797541 RepID=UPI0025E12C19|nr:hypothetical protein [uncultured Mucilaginibacter sp.]
MKKILTLGLFILISGIAFAQQPLFRYYNPKQNKHYYTTNFNEYRNGTGDWAFEGITCRVFAEPRPNQPIKELFRYFSPKTGDHFYTMRLHELGMGDAGYNFEGVACYIYNFHVPGSIPLFRYYNAVANDHFYTTDKRELGRGFEGYNLEQVAGFVLHK